MILLSALSVCAVLDAEPATRLLQFDTLRLAQLASSAGATGDVVGVSRSGDGTHLFLTVKTNSVSGSYSESLVAVFSEKGVALKAIPRGAAELTEDGTPICSYSNGCFVFRGGERLGHAPGAFIKFSPDRSLFFLSGANAKDRARLFRTASPARAVLVLPEGFFPQKIFSTTNGVLLFGQRAREHSRAGDRTACAGLEFSWTGNELQPLRELNLSRFGAVLDMDPRTGSLLVDGRHDTLRSWGIYSPATRKFQRLGLQRDSVGLFVSAGLSERLEQALQIKGNK